MSAPSDIQLALEDITGSDLAWDAYYQSGDSPAYKIRLTRSDIPSGSSGLGGLGVRAPGMEVKVLATEVPDPKENDLITMRLTDDMEIDDPDWLVDAVTYKVRRVGRASGQRRFVLTLNKDAI